MVTATLLCTTADFPCTYLRLPVSTRKIGKAKLLRWIEKISDKLHCWRAALMTMAGSITWVRFVLLAILVYVLIAIKVPKWFLCAIDKITQELLFRREESKWMVVLVWWLGKRSSDPLTWEVLGYLTSSLWARLYKSAGYGSRRQTPTYHGLALMACTFIQMQWLSSTLLWNLRSRMVEILYSRRISGLWAAI